MSTSTTLDALTTHQLEVIADYKRCHPDEIIINEHSAMRSGARGITIVGDLVGWFCPRTDGLVIIDKPNGYVTITRGGEFRFMTGRYYCV